MVFFCDNNVTFPNIRPTTKTKREEKYIKLCYRYRNSVYTSPTFYFSNVDLRNDRTGDDICLDDTTFSYISVFIYWSLPQGFYKITSIRAYRWESQKIP